MVSSTSKSQAKPVRQHERVSPRLPDRRVKAEITLKLTVTLEGEPYERTEAHEAFLDAVEPVVKDIAARHLREERGESVSLEIVGDAPVCELPLFSQCPRLTLVTQSASSGHPIRKKGLVNLS